MLPEKCDTCGGTLEKPCKHILGNPHRLVKWLRQARQELRKTPISHHRWSHDGPCKEGCYYETYD